MNVLVPNLGSTSVKYQILEMPSERVVVRGRMERVTDYREALDHIRRQPTDIDGIVLKTAHGGPGYRGTFIVDDGVIAALRQFRVVASLHNSIYLAAIEVLRDVMPNVPIVASFEPEFHTTIPEHARRYGVPDDWQREGVVRYGFHGASHQFIAERMAVLVGSGTKLVSCHLGGSSSVCAIDHGRSVDTTMGFSPQSGLENATRPGDLDIFAILYMIDRRGWSLDDVQRQLTNGGGLAGISGVAGGDIRDIELSAASGNDAARLALDAFAHQIKKSIGAFAAAMGGIDAIAFTGGIGENSANIRALACAGLDFLGVRIDPIKNECVTGDGLISADDSLVSVWVVPTNEELVLARRAFRLLASPVAR